MAEAPGYDEWVKESSNVKGEADIGLIGLAVMGENLALNIAHHGFKISVFNRTVSKVHNFVSTRGKLDNVIGTRTAEEFVASLKSPRVVFILVMAGKPVDQTIEGLLPYLEKGDIIVDGGNSHFPDTERRSVYLKEKGIHFVGAGVSGGEEGALLGPSIMPGGAPEAWPRLKPILQTISAKAGEAKEPCCDWISTGGSGHFVKMVHNGIEYGDMQLIAEAYFLLKNIGKLSNLEIHQVFEQWNKGPLDSYLIEITKDIVAASDPQNPKEFVLDTILDAAGQKGTGKWTATAALDLGMPLTLIGEAVFARCLSALKDERVRASKELPAVEQVGYQGTKEEFIKDVHDALYASKIVSYAQGFVLLSAAAIQNKWEFNYGEIANMWRGGCIIRSAFLGNIKQAFENNRDIENLLLDSFFKNEVINAQAGWRRTAAASVLNGIAAPAITSALAYYDGYRTENGPANLIQAQRDYFGAHTYEKIDTPRGTYVHFNWTGRGGNTTSGSYLA